MIGRPHRRRCGASSSARLLIARYDGEHPLFEQARCRAVGLQVRSVNRDALGLWPFAGKAGEDAVEHAEPAPADKAVIECLVRPVVLRCVFPLQPCLMTWTMPLITRRSSTLDTPMRKREERRYPCHLAFTQQKQITHHDLLSETVNHISSRTNRS